MSDQLKKIEALKPITEPRTKTMEELKIEREAKKDIVVEYLRKLPVYKWAAASAGISKDTLENWRAEDKEFSARCETAKAEAIQKLGGRATPDFILKNVDPETFKDKKDVELSGEPLIVIKHGS